MTLLHWVKQNQKVCGHFQFYISLKSSCPSKQSKTNFASDLIGMSCRGHISVVWAQGAVCGILTSLLFLSIKVILSMMRIEYVGYRQLGPIYPLGLVEFQNIQNLNLVISISICQTKNFYSGHFSC